jgi:hypothetical protein
MTYLLLNRKAKGVSNRPTNRLMRLGKVPLLHNSRHTFQVDILPQFNGPKQLHLMVISIPDQHLSSPFNIMTIYLDNLNPPLLCLNNQSQQTQIYMVTGPCGRATPGIESHLIMVITTLPSQILQSHSPRMFGRGTAHNPPPPSILPLALTHGRKRMAAITRTEVLTLRRGYRTPTHSLRWVRHSSKTRVLRRPTPVQCILP